MKLLTKINEALLEYSQQILEQLTELKTKIKEHIDNGDHDSIYYRKSETDDKISSAEQKASNELNTHKTSGDHDSRYYRKGEVDNKITEATESLDAGIGEELDTHKSSGDHDARYYRKSEVSDRISNAESRANQLTDLRYQQTLDAIINVNPAVVANEEQAASLRGENESFQEVFDNWIRFSHLAGERPFSEAHLNAWEYDAENDRIVSQLNSPSTVGFVSLDRYENFVFDVIVDSDNADDDLIGIVVAYAEDAQGRGNAIYAFRTPGGIGHTPNEFISTRRWLFNVGMNVSDANSDMPAIDLGSNNNGLIWGDTRQVDADRNITSDVGAWSTYGRVRIRAERNGDHFKIMTSNPNSMDLVPEATVEFNLTDHPELSIFRGGAAVGYTQHSQVNSFFETLQRPSSQSEIADIENNVLWVNDGNDWVSEPLDESGAIESRRFYLNAQTRQLFFSDVESRLVELPTVETLGEILNSQQVGYVSAVRDTRVINGGASRTYDLQSILGILSSFEVEASNISIRIKDNISGSPTNGMFINSESMITYAIDNNRYVRVFNVSDVNLECSISVDVPKR